MILVEFTPEGGSIQRISNEDIALTYQWFGFIIAMPSFSIGLPTRHGGFAKPEFSEMTISPDLMLELGGYPKNATVRMLWTETTEAAATVLFTGTAKLDTYDRHGFTYVLKQPDLDDTISASTAYNDTLVNVVSGLCTTLGLTLNSTAARSPSPAVLHTTSSDQLAIDLLSGMCSSFSHGAKIVESTLYLYDILGTRTETAITEFETQPCEYRDDKPYSLFKASDTESLPGTATNGEEYSVEIYHTGSTEIQAALANIKIIMEQSIPVLRFKANQLALTILDQFSYLDESMVLPTTSTATVYTINYNFDSLNIEAEGSGSVTV